MTSWRSRFEVSWLHLCGMFQAHLWFVTKGRRLRSKLGSYDGAFRTSTGSVPGPTGRKIRRFAGYAERSEWSGLKHVRGRNFMMKKKKKTKRKRNAKARERQQMLKLKWLTQAMFSVLMSFWSRCL